MFSARCVQRCLQYCVCHTVDECALGPGADGTVMVASVLRRRSS